MNKAQEEQKKDVLEFVEEKFERRLTEEISKLEGRLSEKIAAGDNKLLEKIIAVEKGLSEKIMTVEKGLSEKIAAVDKSLLEKISEEGKKASQHKAELIKWMFIFWIGQISVILGILFTFFKR